MTSTALLGYVGETNARPVTVEGMEIDGADRYVMTIDYGDGVTYEVDITGGQWTPTADILRSAQTVSCQIAAKKLSGDEYILVKKSRIFRLRIGAAIGDTAIPSPSVAADALDRIDAIGRQTHADMQTAVTAAETATTAAENAEKSATTAGVSADTATQAASRAETAKTAAETAAQTAQAVADSLPEDYVTAVSKIAENTAEIGRIKLTDKELTRRVNALYDIGQGVTHRFETDTDTAYAKTVPTGGKLMSVKSVGGRSIVWNQLISQIVEKTSNGIATTKIDSKSLHISGTSSAVCFIPISPVQTGISNHKYLFHSHASDTTALSSGTGFYNDNGGNRWHEYGKGIIFTMDGNGTIAIAFRVNSNITVDFSITPQIYDLTAMFGSENEPTSVEEFEEMFPADYYPYNAGEIISAGTEEIVEQEKNLFDYTDKIYHGTNVSKVENGVIYTKRSTTTVLNIPTIVGSKYTLSFKVKSSGANQGGLRWSLQKGKNTSYAHDSSLIKSEVGYTANTEYQAVATFVATTDFVSLCTIMLMVYDVQLELGDTATDYSPFYQTEYLIPEVIKALPGYGWSAGTAKNYVDYENKRYVQCVSSVDLGTLTWMKTSSQSVGDYFYAPVSAIGFKRLSAFGITVHNILCSKYITVARNPNAFVDKTIVLDGDSIAVSQIQVKDTAYTDATAFKQAMSGVMLYYELAAPIVTDISSLIPDDFLRNIEVEAGGSVTFKGGNDDYRIPVPSEEEYIVRLSEVGGTT
jgi:hypothetical protein